MGRTLKLINLRSSRTNMVLASRSSEATSKQPKKVNEALVEDTKAIADMKKALESFEPLLDENIDKDSVDANACDLQRQHEDDHARNFKDIQIPAFFQCTEFFGLNKV